MTIDIKKIAELYGFADFSVISETDSSRGNADKRFAFLLRGADGRELIIKVCRNSFTYPERVEGWKKLCAHYLSAGIYCPQIIISENGSASEAVYIEGEEYTVYAEEVKKHKTYEELEIKPDFEIFKKQIIASVGKIAANPAVPLSWNSPYCLYGTFCAEDTADENYLHAQEFCETALRHFPQHAEYIKKIWETFLEKRKAFEPIYYALPKASFQSDLNRSNILVDGDKFAGLIDFNLAGTESVLCYVLLPLEGCSYNLEAEDLERLADKDFLKKCDGYFYENLAAFNKHYKFSGLEKENFNLCYNAVIPFSCWMAGGLLNYAVREGKAEHAKNILDWVYFQLTRNDIKI